LKHEDPTEPFQDDLWLRILSREFILKPKFKGLALSSARGVGRGESYGHHEALGLIPSTNKKLPSHKEFLQNLHSRCPQGFRQKMLLWPRMVILFPISETKYKKKDWEYG
jgi:hypothetical protein